MRKTMWILAVMLVFVLAVTACGKKAEKKEASTERETSAAEEAEGTETAEGEPAEAITLGAGMTVEEIDDSTYLVFTVDERVELERNAWLGFVPSGKIYKTEEEADEVDFCYAYYDDPDASEKSGYRFKFEVETISEWLEDGRYDIVLCTSDDAPAGEVILQVGIEKNGSAFTLEE